MAFSCKVDLPLLETSWVTTGEPILSASTEKNPYDNEDRNSCGALRNSTKCHLEAEGCQRRETKLIKIQNRTGSLTMFSSGSR